MFFTLLNTRWTRPPVPNLAGSLCLVTGAASGIGRATARAAAAQGAWLIVTDINAEPLEELADELGDAVLLARALDISDFDEVRALADDVHAAHGPVDVVMNIAGIATWGRVEALTHQQWRSTVDVNLMGPIHVIECFVTEMIRNRRPGHLVNVSSAAGLLGLPLHGPYSASKFGLCGVSQVLRYDLRRDRIGVSLVCPGAVDTGLVDTLDLAGVSHEARHASGFTDRFRKHADPPEHVANTILDAVVHNRFLVYTSWDIHFFHLVERWAPPLYGVGMQIANDLMQFTLRRASARHSEYAGQP